MRVLDLVLIVAETLTALLSATLVLMSIVTGSDDSLPTACFGMLVVLFSRSVRKGELP